MAVKKTVYQAADGSIHETEAEARHHDAYNAIASQASDYIQAYVKNRTVSKSRAERLLVDFAMKLIFPDTNKRESELTGEGQDPQGGSEKSDFGEND